MTRYQIYAEPTYEYIMGGREGCIVSEERDILLNSKLDFLHVAVPQTRRQRGFFCMEVPFTKLSPSIKAMVAEQLGFFMSFILLDWCSFFI